MDRGDTTSGIAGDQPHPPLDPADFAAPEFTKVRMSEGYDMGEVDRFALLLAAAVQQTPPGITAEEIEKQRFTPVRIRQGYDMGEVDEWLDSVAVRLTARAKAAMTPPHSGPIDLSVFAPPTFGVVRLREGYDKQQVEAFAEELRVKAHEVPVGITAEEVESVRFKPVQLRSGYDMGEVDAWLDRVAAELRR